MAVLITSLGVLLSIFAFGQLTRLEIAPGIALSGLDLAVAGFGIFWIFRQISQQKFHWSPVAKGFGIFVALAAFSLLLNVFHLPQKQALVALFYLLRFILYAVLFFVTYSFSKSQKILVKNSLVIAGGEVVALGFFQYIFYPALRNLLYAGWDEHYYRMFGTFLDPNFLGLFFVVYALLLLSYLFESRGKRKLLFSFLFSVTCLALFLTYSRTALITMLISSTTMLFLQGKKLLAGVLITVLIIGSSLLFMLPLGKTESTNMLRVVSSEARLKSMQEAVTVWQKNVLFGVGFNAYRYALYGRGAGSGAWEESHGGAGSDNSFLFVLATMGIVGLAGFFFLLWQHIHELLLQKDRGHRSLGIATILGLCLGSFFINGFFYPSLMLWLWMVLGITENT